MTILLAVALFGPTTVKWLRYADCAFYASLKGSSYCDCTKILTTGIQEANANETTVGKTTIFTGDWTKIPAPFVATAIIDCFHPQQSVYSFSIPLPQVMSIFHPPSI